MDVAGGSFFSALSLSPLPSSFPSFFLPDTSAASFASVPFSSSSFTGKRDGVPDASAVA